MSNNVLFRGTERIVRAYKSSWGILLFCVYAVSSFAQGKKEAPKSDVRIEAAKTADAPLPKIDLPEFVITGQENLQPMNMTKEADESAPVYVLPSPTAGKRPSAAFDATRLSKSAVHEYNSMNGILNAGFGIYATPSIDGWFGKNYNEGLFDIHGNYSSSAGHVAESGWQKWGIGTDGRYFLPSTGSMSGTSFSAAVQFSGEKYHNYGSANPSIERSMANASVKVGMDVRPNRSNVYFQNTDYTSMAEYQRFAISDTTGATEHQLFMQSTVRSQLSEYEVTGTIGYKTSFLSMNLPPPVDQLSPQWIFIDLEARRDVLPELELKAGLRQYLYRGNIGAVSGRLFPLIDLRYRYDDQSTAFVTFSPEVGQFSLSKVFGMNRYIIKDVVLKPAVTPMAISVGTVVQMTARLWGKIGLAYRLTDDDPTFLEKNNAKVWEVTYLSSVRRIIVDAQAQYRFSAENEAGVYATFMSARQSDSTNVIPFTPSFVMSIVDRYTLSDHCTMEVTGEYVSQRMNNLANSSSNAAYATVNLKGEYRISDQFRSILIVRNLLDRQYYLWDNYPERRFFLSLGANIVW